MTDLIEFIKICSFLFLGNLLIILFLLDLNKRKKNINFYLIIYSILYVITMFIACILYGIKDIGNILVIIFLNYFLALPYFIDIIKGEKQC